MGVYMKKYYYFKFLIDVLAAIILLIIFLPLGIFITILIRLESKGSPIFLQERLGQNGVVFNIVKFRTMVDNAINMGDGIHVKDGDSRITKVGNILRKTSLDELPQLINIIKGDMSFIGPRPPLPYYPRPYAEYDHEQKKRFILKPGITGYAQVMVRNSAPWDERIKLDIIYYDKIGILFDIKIFFMTIYTVLKRDNVY